jgi:hypothetical protein
MTFFYYFILYKEKKRRPKKKIKSMASSRNNYQCSNNSSFCASNNQLQNRPLLYQIMYYIEQYLFQNRLFAYSIDEIYQAFIEPNTFFVKINAADITTNFTKNLVKKAIRQGSRQGLYNTIYNPLPVYIKSLNQFVYLNTFNKYNQNYPMNLTSACLENCTTTNSSKEINVEFLPNVTKLNDIEKLNGLSIENLAHDFMKVPVRETLIFNDGITRYAYNPNAANLNPKNISFLWSYNTGSPVVSSNNNMALFNMPKNTARDIKGASVPGPNNIPLGILRSSNGRCWNSQFLSYFE